MAFHNPINAPGRNFVDFIVGGSEQKFSVHKDLICALSPYFNAAFTSNLEEGKTGIMKLPTTSIKTFALFWSWLHNKQILWDPSANSVPCPSTNTLMKLYVFADMAQIILLKNQCIDAINDISQIEGAFPIETIGYVFDNTGKGSPIRRFIVDSLAWELDPDILQRLLPYLTTEVCLETMVAMRTVIHTSKNQRILQALISPLTNIKKYHEVEGQVENKTAAGIKVNAPVTRLRINTQDAGIQPVRKKARVNASSTSSVSAPGVASRPSSQQMDFISVKPNTAVTTGLPGVPVADQIISSLPLAAAAASTSNVQRPAASLVSTAATPTLGYVSPYPKVAAPPRQFLPVKRYSKLAHIRTTAQLPVRTFASLPIAPSSYDHIFKRPTTPRSQLPASPAYEPISPIKVKTPSSTKMRSIMDLAIEAARMDAEKKVLAGAKERAEIEKLSMEDFKGKSKVD